MHSTKVKPANDGAVDLSLPLLGDAPRSDQHAFEPDGAVDKSRDSKSPGSQIQAPSGCYMRHTMCFMALIMITCAYYQRTNLSVAILDMSKELGYSSSDSGLILSSFFIGYIFSQLPGGHLAAKFGAKPIIGCSIFLSGLVSAATPAAARSSFSALIALRIALGLVQGALYPSIMTLWSVWAPPMERSKMCATALAGSVLGTLLSMPISSLLCTSAIGWPLAFYFSGGFACLCAVLWAVVADSSPASSRWARAAEVTFIQRAIAAGSFDDQAAAALGTQQVSAAPASAASTLGHIGPFNSILQVPWMHVVTRPCILALFVAQFANGWGFYTLLTWLPKYLATFVHLGSKANASCGSFAALDSFWPIALPYAARATAELLSAQAIDVVRARRLLTTCRARKIWTIVGFLGPAAALSLTSIIPLSQPITIVITITAAVMLSAFAMAGYGSKFVFGFRVHAKPHKLTQATTSMLRPSLQATCTVLKTSSAPSLA
jgi:sugar phosphate permease